MLIQHDTPINRLLNLVIMNRGKLVEETVTGNPVSFETDVARPLKGLSIPFTSESGLTGLNIYRTGINAFDGVLEQGALDGNGENTPSTANYRSKDFIPVIPGASYRPVFNIVGGGSNMKVFYYYKDKTRKRDAWTSPGNTIIIDADVCFVRFYMDTAWSEATDRTIGFNYSATATEFEPYSGTTIPVSFGETVNEGTLDALTGVMTVISPESKTVQLDPVTLSTLIGENVIWTDTNGTNEITYMKKG